MTGWRIAMHMLTHQPCPPTPQLYMKKALKDIKAKKPNLSHKEAFTEVRKRESKQAHAPPRPCMLVPSPIKKTYHPRNQPTTTGCQGLEERPREPQQGQVRGRAGLKRTPVGGSGGGVDLC